MKKTIFIFLLFFYSHFSYSQWVQQNSPSTANLLGINFINSNTGWICGGGGAMLKTTNGGINWNSQSTGTSQDLYTVFFINSNTGWSGGMNGAFLRTTNGGTNWTFQILIPSEIYYGIYFLNSNTGWMTDGPGAIYYTTNSGTNWISQFTSGSGYLIPITFVNSSTGWAAGAGGSIVKTTNGGVNWFTQISNSTANFLSIDMLDVNTGWVVGGNGIIRKTTNGGTNWITQTSASPNGISGVSFFSSSIGYISGYFGIIQKSTNGGTNWTTDTSIGGYGFNSISIPNPNVAYVIGDLGRIYKNTFFQAKLNNVYKSAGRVMSSTVILSDSLCKGTIDSIYWYINDSLVGRQHTMGYTYRQGTSFIKLKIKNNSGQVDSAMAMVTVLVYQKNTPGQILAGNSLIGSNILYAISTGDAIYRMDNNGNTLYTLNVAGNVLSSCSISYDTSVYICSSDYNLYGFSKTGSPLWSAISLGAAATCTPTIDSASNRLYLGVGNNNFYAINRLTGTVAWNYFMNAPIKSSAVISTDRKLVFASSRGTIYGYDLNNIQSPYAPKWTLYLNDSIITSPAIDNQGYFYFGSRTGKVYKIDLPLASTTGSVVWLQYLNSPVTSSPTIDANGNIYMGTEDGKLNCLKPNGFFKWSYQSLGTIKSTAAITPSMILFFGNDAGEVIGLDTNKNLKFYALDTSKVSCAMLYKDAVLYLGNEGGKLYAFYDTNYAAEKTGRGIPIWGTFQNNVRRTGSQRDGGSIGIKQISDIVPDKFELYQNYPNPFNPSTIIKFQIPNAENGKLKMENSNVALKIYDILGREIITLVNEKLQPGVYEIQFSNNQLASGIYFYKLTNGEFTEIKKMILMK